MASKKSGGELSVALLRGINVSGHKKVPMAELRALAEGLGWRDVATYIQSGNLVFRGKDTAPAAERRLEQAIEAHFGFAVPVAVRGAAWWHREVADVPFAEVDDARAKFVHLGIAKQKLAVGAAAALAPYCKFGERIVVRGEELWIDYAEAVADSKLQPAVVDRCVGSTVTMRNLKTLRAIDELLRAADGA